MTLPTSQLADATSQAVGIRPEGSAPVLSGHPFSVQTGPLSYAETLPFHLTAVHRRSDGGRP